MWAISLPLTPLLTKCVSLLLLSVKLQKCLEELFRFLYLPFLKVKLKSTFGISRGSLCENSRHTFVIGFAF